MQEKQIHIVFQVLNFISSPISEPYNLSADEQLLLLLLAKHHGPKGIYPSKTTLAKERKILPRAIRKTLLKLINKGLLIVDSRLGKTNYYTIMLPYLSTTHVLQDTGDTLSPMSSRTLLPMSSRTPTHVLQDTQSNKIIKSDYEKDQRESRKSKRCAPSPSFLYDQKIYKLLGEKNLDFNFVHEKFMAWALSEGKEFADQNAAFQKFIMNEKSPLQNGNEKVIAIAPQQLQVSKCDQCGYNEYSCRCNISSKETAQKNLQQIIGNLLHSKRI